ncbi:hypothetical protein BDZ91DRAFT_720478 [Kalaharituber pfeilii]|nr:hypothetical protein BDZ91DRAFT_720478 [Kalaharituber pfeilii]
MTAFLPEQGAPAISMRIGAGGGFVVTGAMGLRRGGGGSAAGTALVVVVVIVVVDIFDNRCNTRAAQRDTMLLYEFICATKRCPCNVRMVYFMEMN